MSERARPELARAVDPPHDPSRAQLVRDAREKLRLGGVLGGEPILGGETRQLGRLRLGSPEGMVGHLPPGIAEVHPVGVQRGAEGAACVTWSGRHEHALEPALAQDARVRAAVQRHAAAQAQVRQARLGAQRGGEIDQRIFEDPLHGGSDVRAVAPVLGGQVDGFPGLARRAERVEELRGVRASRGEVVVEIRQIEREAAVRRAEQHLPDLRGKRGTAVRREAHHLVLALVDGEPQPGGEGRVEHPERVWEADLAERLDFAAPISAHRPAPEGQRRPLAHSVGRQNRRRTRRRGEEGGCGVGLVVLGEEDLAAGEAQVRGDDPLHPQLLAQRVLHCAREAPPGAREPAQRHGQDALELQHRLLVEHDRVELFRLEPGAIEAPLDGRQREPGVVLPAREPLFLHRADG